MQPVFRIVSHNSKAFLQVPNSLDSHARKLIKNSCFIRPIELYMPILCISLCEWKIERRRWAKPKFYWWHVTRYPNKSDVLWYIVSTAHEAKWAKNIYIGTVLTFGVTWHIENEKQIQSKFILDHQKKKGNMPIYANKWHTSIFGEGDPVCDPLRLQQPIKIYAFFILTTLKQWTSIRLFFLARRHHQLLHYKYVINFIKF